MKKYAWGILLFIGLSAKAQTINLNYIKAIESGANRWAYNKTDGGSRGLYQIHPIGLKDYNKYHKVKYTTMDLYNVKINTKIAKWMFEVRLPQLLEHYKYPVTEDNLIISYNAGITYVVYNKTIPQITKDYLAKYKKLKN